MSGGPQVVLVAAVARNGVIGCNGSMPWKLSSDLKRFKRDTMGKPVIMGRKTFESIGKALPGRLNIVISRSAFCAENVVHAQTVDAALFVAQGWANDHAASEICIIGGGEIYALTFDLASRLYITQVQAEPDGDTYFPEIKDANWQIVESIDVPAGENDSAATRYVVYERVNSPT